jgi:Tfp pilus assembly protein PilN
MAGTVVWQICSLVTRIQVADEEKEQQRQTIVELTRQLELAKRHTSDVEQLQNTVREKDEKINQV